MEHTIFLGAQVFIEAIKLTQWKSTKLAPVGQNDNHEDNDEKDDEESGSGRQRLNS